jgi:hypothetical protein
MLPVASLTSIVSRAICCTSRSCARSSRMPSLSAAPAVVAEAGFAAAAGALISNRCLHRIASHRIASNCERNDRNRPSSGALLSSMGKARE